MHQSSTIKNPNTSQFNIIFSQTLNKALYNKELFYYPNIKRNNLKIDEQSYNEAKKILANLDTIYFDLDKEEKKLYRQLEKIIINYTLQK